MAKQINIPLTLIAKIGLWLDDPYGDGIRLESIRQPNDGRHAALAQRGGSPNLGGEREIRKEYESKVRELVKLEKRRKNPELLMQKVLTVEEAASLGITKKEPAYRPVHHLELDPFINSLEDVAEHIQSLIAEHGKDAHLNWVIATGSSFGGYRVQPTIH